MCGRYSLFTPRERLSERFDATPVRSFDARYNCTPGQSLPVVTGDRMESFQWGLVPSWADESSTDLINARAETLWEKPSFAESFERRRCLVPADGFYEWVGDRGEKRPYRVAFEDDRPFAMAGIWDRWRPSTRQTGLGEFAGETTGDAEPLDSFAIVTTEPNELVSDLHHRMALILSPEEEATWLDGTPEEAHGLLDPHPADEMTAYPVSRRVNDPRNDAPDLVERVEA